MSLSAGRIRSINRALAKTHAAAYTIAGPQPSPLVHQPVLVDVRYSAPHHQDRRGPEADLRLKSATKIGERMRLPATRLAVSRDSCSERGPVDYLDLGKSGCSCQLP